MTAHLEMCVMRQGNKKAGIDIDKKLLHLFAGFLYSSSGLVSIDHAVAYTI